MTVTQACFGIGPNDSDTGDKKSQEGIGPNDDEDSEPQPKPPLPPPTPPQPQSTLHEDGVLR